jgi:acetyl esterase/lipase
LSAGAERDVKSDEMEFQAKRRPQYRLYPCTCAKGRANHVAATLAALTNRCARGQNEFASFDRTCAQVAELADALDSGSSARKGVEVRILSWAPYITKHLRRRRSRAAEDAAQIKTLTLILSDTGDFRVTITQSYQLFHALKDNGVPVKFFAYPVAGHSPPDPVRKMDVYRCWVEWLDQYLK